MNVTNDMELRQAPWFREFEDGVQIAECYPAPDGSIVRFPTVSKVDIDRSNEKRRQERANDALRLNLGRFYGRYATARLGNVESGARDILERFTANPVGTVILTGKNGSGKTYAACACVNQATSEGRKARIVSTTDALSSDDPVKLTSILTASDVSFVALDDFGAERDTAYGTEQLEALIDRLYTNAKPILVTTNLPEGMFSQPTQRLARCIDRLCENAVFCGFGGSYR